MKQCRFNRLHLIVKVFTRIVLLCYIISTTISAVNVNIDKAAMKSIPDSWIGPGALSRSVFIERQEKLQYNCDNLPRKDKYAEVNDSSLFHNFLVDDMHKLLYCYVPKVACTNWKRIFMLVMGKSEGNDPLTIPADQAHASGTFKRLSNYTLSEITEKLKTYDKFLVVRHPLERLLSAYRNKFETKNKYFQSRFGKRIIKKYRSNATQESLNTGNDVTFPEFVNFITDGKNNESQNEHWRPIAKLCHPCLVNFNIISKYETLSEDAVGVLERMESKSILFPTLSPLVVPTSKKLNKYYSTLSFKQIQNLLDMYKLDLLLFDYSLEEILGFSLY